MWCDCTCPWASPLYVMNSCLCSWRRVSLKRDYIIISTPGDLNWSRFPFFGTFKEFLASPLVLLRSSSIKQCFLPLVNLSWWTSCINIQIKTSIKNDFGDIFQGRSFLKSKFQLVRGFNNNRRNIFPYGKAKTRPKRVNSRRNSCVV